MNDSGFNSKGDSISLKSVFKTDSTPTFDYNSEFPPGDLLRRTQSPESGNELAETQRD